ncbi:peroxiredoxin [Amaricoccus tamworthensis]|uniref:peroxiredoxin n=1 Tax=Amaricoccus tamworthensis TaxID=57002 RepID=UPI003C7A945D
MSLSIGDKLPEAEFLEMIGEDMETLSTGDLFTGKRVVVFALPGAYTSTCTNRHLPSYVQNADRIRTKGVDDIICLSVNDPFVMSAWGEANGASGGNVRMIADATGAFTKAVGMDFSVPSRGLIDRSRRYSMIVDNGVVVDLFAEEGTGCEISAGETMLEKL